MDYNISLSGLNEAINTYKEIDLYSSSIILAWRGSVAHGIYIPKHIDDKDLMGVICLPIDYYFGLKSFGNKNTKTIAYKEWDLVFYELRKFFKLLLNSNPNVLGLLWLKDEHYINLTDEGRALISARDKFLSKRVYHSFVGYAHGQLKRMTHYKYEGYMGTKRKELVDKYGYDCKNAAHLIRLLRMGIETLQNGHIKVYRDEDRDQLIQIKNGEWCLDNIKSLSDSLFKKIKLARDKTSLPEEPDSEFANKLLIDILEKRTKIGCYEKEILSI